MVLEKLTFQCADFGCEQIAHATVFNEAAIIGGRKNEYDNGTGFRRRSRLAI